MDVSEVERFVIEALPQLSALLGLHDWEITIGYIDETSDDDGSVRRGECARLVDYHSAHISLNPSALKDTAALVVTLRHELFHVILAPFDLYTSAVEGIEMPVVAADLLARIRDHALERCVAGLERLFAN